MYAMLPRVGNAYVISAATMPQVERDIAPFPTSTTSPRILITFLTPSPNG